MPKTDSIELRDRRAVYRIPILYEDRAVLAVDKPAGWMLVPFTWQRTNRNLQAAITSSIAAGEFWACSRNLKFLRFVHRLDADTTGILLFAKSPGAVRAMGDLFESRQMEKRYLAVVPGIPAKNEWTCEARIAPDPRQHGRMMLSPNGKEAETHFRLLEARGGRALIEARPLTGRTHQIRLHLAAAGLPVVGDDLYAQPKRGEGENKARSESLLLRAVELAYRDPFTRKRVHIRASTEMFLREAGMS